MTKLAIFIFVLMGLARNSGAAETPLQTVKSLLEINQAQSAQKTDCRATDPDACLSTDVRTSKSVTDKKRAAAAIEPAKAQPKTSQALDRSAKLIAYKYDVVDQIVDDEPISVAAAAPGRKAKIANSKQTKDPKALITQCKANIAEACHKLGFLANEKGKLKVASKMYDRACKLGHAKACRNLGITLRDNGRGKLSAQYLSRACIAGDAVACRMSPGGKATAVSAKPATP